MLNKLLKREKGFTLIEIVIVLAIAALIILVVFQAVGAAQRSQRDTKRKEEAGRISALLEQYASNTNGTYPANGSPFDSFVDTYDNYLGVTQDYNDNGTCPAPQSPTTYDVRYVPTGTPARGYELYVCLEVGGEAQIK